MIARAVFWTGLVSVLVPGEPDIGLGRPNALSTSSPTVERWATDNVADLGWNGGLALPVDGGVGIVWKFRESALQAVPRIKAEIELSLHSRR
jgi:hypothetical protein